MRSCGQVAAVISNLVRYFTQGEGTGQLYRGRTAVAAVNQILNSAVRDEQEVAFASSIR
ncbi:MAG: hypothetical protein H6545_03080 [Bacteroidales bacterium]|nr:hypothetical protein [Bacteroidales bacterium]